MIEIFRPTVDLVKRGLEEVIQSWGKAIDVRTLSALLKLGPVSLISAIAL